MVQSKVSVLELAKDLGLPYNTMFRVAEKLRIIFTWKLHPSSLKGVELDEVYVKLD
jgi:hypothetical protein